MQVMKAVNMQQLKLKSKMDWNIETTLSQWANNSFVIMNYKMKGKYEVFLYTHITLPNIN